MTTWTKKLSWSTVDSEEELHFSEPILRGLRLLRVPTSYVGQTLLQLGLWATALSSSL